jgi:hypothetical protein
VAPVAVQPRRAKVQPRVSDVGGVHAPADAIARFEHDHVDAVVVERAGEREPCGAGPDDDHARVVAA